jgi:hypothetical protein
VHALKFRARTSTNNEHFVQNSARVIVEYQQMEQRVRLDIPTLSDPTVRDLLAESDLFVSSFQGAGGFGLLSPFDLIRVFSLISELASHVFVLSTISYGPLSIFALLISFLSAAYPLVQSSLLPQSYRFDTPIYTEEEIRLTEKQEQMRQLSLSDTHRPEVMLFGLGPWILETWASARQAVLGLHSSQQSLQSPSSIFSHMNVVEIIAALQNVSLHSIDIPLKFIILSFIATVCINAANFHFSRLSRIVSQLRAVYRVHHQHAIYHPPDGNTGGISYGRFLRLYGDRTISSTEGRISCQIRVLVRGDEN